MRTSEGDMAKKLDQNEAQQEETQPAKKAIEKIKLTADNIQEYGTKHFNARNTAHFDWLSWFP